jgi:hypothetical protein
MAPADTACGEPGPAAAVEFLDLGEPPGDVSRGAAGRLSSDSAAKSAAASHSLATMCMAGA